MASYHCRIVLAEDNRSDAGLIRMALRHRGMTVDVQECTDGEHVLHFIDQADALTERPDLLILDLNLPRYNGHDVMARWRDSPVLGHVPILVFTSSESPDDLNAIAKYTPHYLRKPLDLDEFLESVGNCLEQILGACAAAAGF